jgi:hypothetical protein
MVRTFRFFGAGTDIVRAIEHIGPAWQDKGFTTSYEVPEGQHITATLMTPADETFSITAEYGAVDDNRWAIGIIGRPTWEYYYEIMSPSDTSEMLVVHVPDDAWLGRIIIR